MASSQFLKFCLQPLLLHYCSSFISSGCASRKSLYGNLLLRTNPFESWRILWSVVLILLSKLHGGKGLWSSVSRPPTAEATSVAWEVTGIEIASASMCVYMALSSISKFFVSNCSPTISHRLPLQHHLSLQCLPSSHLSQCQQCLWHLTTLPLPRPARVHPQVSIPEGTHIHSTTWAWIQQLSQGQVSNVW